MAICVNVERMYAVVFPLKTVGWRRYMLPVCLAVATLYNIPKVDAERYNTAYFGQSVARFKRSYFWKFQWPVGRYLG